VRPRLDMPLAVVMLAMLALVTLAPVRAQDARDSSFLFGKLWFVAASTEVATQIDACKKAETSGNWHVAATRLQHILDYDPEHVVSIDEQAFVGARDWVVRRIAGWPDAGREAYRALVDARALIVLEQGLETKSIATLNDVWLQFPFSSHAGTAASAAGHLHLSAGRFRDSADMFTALLEGDIPNVISRSDLRVRLAFALTRLGDAEAVAAVRDDQARHDAGDEVVMGGTRRKALATLDAYVAEVGPGRGAPDGWPHYGGSAGHDRLQGPPIDPGPLQWAADDVDGLSLSRRVQDLQYNEYMSSPSGWPDHLQDWYPIHPVLAGGHLIAHDGHTVQARDPFTGELRWEFLAPMVRETGRTNFGTVYSASTSPDAVYMGLEIPGRKVPETNSRAFRNIQIIYPIPERRLFALDLGTGEKLWSHQDDEIEDWPEAAFLKSVTVDTPPLVVGDRLYVPMTLFEGRYNVHLCTFDRHTGRLLWKTWLCNAQMELNLFGRPVKEAAPSTVTWDGRHVYVCTNLGIIACVDPRTALVRWIRGYPQIPIPHSRDWYRVTERDPTWTNAPPIVKNGILLATPTDSNWLIALGAEDGRTLWRVDRGTDSTPRAYAADVMSELLGVDDRHAYVAGTSVYAIDIRTGKLRWMGEFQDGEKAVGRGAVTDGIAYCATAAALYAFDSASGEVRWRRAWEDMGGPAEGARAGGNLLVQDGILVVSDRDAIEAYYDWKGVFKKLEEQLADHPDDLRLRLHAARIYLRGGQMAEAEKSFRTVAHLATRLPEEPAARLTAEAARGLHDVGMARAKKALATDALGHARTLLTGLLPAAPDARARIEVRLLLVLLADARGDKAEAVEQLRTMAEQDGDAKVNLPGMVRCRVGPEALMRAAHRNLGRGHPAEAIRDLQTVIARYREEPLADGDAGIIARRMIDKLIRDHGWGVYAEVDAKAAEALDAARETGRERPLLDIVLLYPNSVAAPRALVAIAHLRMAAGDYREGANVLRRRMQFSSGRAEDAQALALLAVCQEKRGRYAAAHGILTKLRHRYADVHVRVDGKKVLAGVFVSARLAREEYESAAAAVGIPLLKLPLTSRWKVDEGEESMTRLLRTKGVVPERAHGKTYVLSDAMLFCRDARSGEILWRQPAVNVRDLAVFCDERLVMHGQDAVTALDPGTGQVVWTFDPDEPIWAFTASEDMVFVLLGSPTERNVRTLVALSAHRGGIVWRRPLEGRYSDWLLLTPDAVVTISSRPSAIRVHDALTGRLDMEIKLGDGIHREPFLIDGSRLVVIQGNREIALWDLSLDRRAWRHELPAGQYFRSALPMGRHILVTDMGDVLRLLDGVSGKQLWAVPVPSGRNLAYEGEAVDDDHVYITHRDEEGSFMASAIRKSDGALLWSRTLIDSRSAHILPTATRNHVMYHTNSYDLGANAWTSRTLILDRNTGEIMQEIEIPDVQGAYSFAVLDRGLLGFFSRGRLVMFGP
jgi:outer membrane protein assembly factor BamB